MKYSGIVRGLAACLAVWLALPLTIAAQPAASTTGETVDTKGTPREGFVSYAVQGDLELLVDEQEAVFLVRDKAGRTWYSTPPAYAEDETAQGSAKMLMASLIRVGYADSLGNINYLNSKVASVNKGTAAVRRIDGGARFTFRFEREGFTVPVEVRLRADGVEVSVVSGEIEESNDKYRLTRVAVAPYMGAAPGSADGYLFVPDGSGALLGYADNNGAGEDYSQYVYGRDAAITQLEAGEVTEEARLPVFGIKVDDQGYAAILTAGASRAVINAAVKGKRCDYSNAYAEFLYRDYDMVLVEKKNQTVRLVESGHTQDARQTVRYVLLTDEEADYVGMAAAYRTYLTEEGGLTPAADAGAPLMVELFGGVTAKQYILGFPVTRVMPLTSYQDAAAIVQALRDAGVSRIAIDYAYWYRGGTGAGIATDLQAEGRLGGGKGLAALEELCRREQVALYLGVNASDMVRSTWGYNQKRDAAASVQRSPAMRYTYDLNTLEAKVSSPTFLLTPANLLDTCRRLADSAKGYDVAGLSTHALGQSLYSDFGKRAIPRDVAEAIWRQSLEALRGGRGGLLVSQANAYALPAATIVTDAPLDSSRFLPETASVPFYQIVLHGLRPLTTPALNEMSDPRRGMLQAVETGSSLKFHWLARGEDVLKETAYNTVTGARYQDWLETATALYAEAAPVLEAVAGQTITAHEQPLTDVARTTFSDGTVVTVNYRETAVTLDGREIPAMSFVYGKGAGA